MNCQHCQTWILDEEHRCHRCGRRVRRTPERLVSGGHVNGYSATATARAYEWHTEPEPQAIAPVEEQFEQQEAEPQNSLFPPIPYSDPTGRVIPFDSLTSRVERQAIRARAAGLERPEPLKTEKVQIRRSRQSARDDQQALEFDSLHHAVSTPQVSIKCDAPVAPASMRLHAAAVDAALMSLPILFGAVLLWAAAGEIPMGKHLLPFYLLAVATIPLLYKSLWTMAGADTPGMRAAGLVLVDFDGNPPSASRRQLRCAGSCLSVLAAGVGLLWSLVDEDRLTWHDHISNTFPTVE